MVTVHDAVRRGIVMLIWDERRCEPLLGNFEEFSEVAGIRV